ncbi:MAG TPA: hypothetical protein DDW36_04405 [Candidatus Magasanikbacteria bacterium]|nr:hypothetical protein [Candidatus Magasanikbacteria bacterium]
MQPENLQKEIQEIKTRNKRVEGDKAWEVSWTRRGFIMMATYIIAGIWLTIIHDSLPWLKACVPAGGYIFSTLSLVALKKRWVERYNK